ncbi:MAG: NADH-quinone oxidoreductase subunit L [Actinomycetota bacterium]|nr:NADH-quinone oxidoreductase subunit L [Actinomycetota bacterium]
MVTAVSLIPLFPLAGFVVLVAAGRRLGNPLAGWLAAGAVTASFVTTGVTWLGLLARPASLRHYDQVLYRWIPAGGFHVNVGFLADPLSMTMALFVTGIAAVIHFYSIGYMRSDPQFPKFFLYLNLFVTSMLILVLSDNYALTFVGWEGVGACSYWLIAFWFDRPSAATAGTKAFVYNRVGDVGYLLAMFLMFANTGSLAYGRVFGAASSGHLSGTVATAVTLLLFMGAVGKSAQIPLYPWLVDAMEGPTPVSALIHAATMVTAGVYVMVRSSPLLALAPATSTVVAIVGVGTAFLAALAACAQTDIKRVLAYSTVSQLGYMFLAVGTGAYVAAIFLMVAHAFYKALLFLGAGSVIHGMHDEQDLRRMGGLRLYMPLTAATFVVAWLAIGGVPPLAGFWAKGDVLVNAWAASPVLWLVGALTAVLTAYYVGRETLLAFYGPERWKELAQRGPHAGGPHSGSGADGGGPAPHESPRLMTVPLVLLAVASTLGGLLDLPLRHVAFLTAWLSPMLVHQRALVLPAATRLALESADAVLALIGVGAAVVLWRGGRAHPRLEPRLLYLGWGLNQLYEALVAVPGRTLAGFAATTFDRGLIDGAVQGVATTIEATGAKLRRVQSGYVRNYALLIAFGAAVLLGYAITRTPL